MSLFSAAVTKRPFFAKCHFHYSTSPSPSHPPLDDTVVTTAVSILKHHRSKSRWSHLRATAPTTGFTPAQVSQIILHLRNNPHLALNFFLFTVRHQLCSHSLSSYATIIHILSRSRLKTQAQSLIQAAFSKFPQTCPLNSPTPPPIFETLIKTYRACDSAPFVFDLLIKACIGSKRIDQAIEIVRMLKSRCIYPRISTFNALIELVSKSKGCFDGCDLYKEILGFDGDTVKNGVKGMVPNARTFNVIMVGFYRDGLEEKVEEVWREMVRMKCVPNAYSYSVLMATYCEDGRMEDAMRVWKEMGDKYVKRDVVAYNTIIGGFCRIGALNRAEEIFREMVMSGLESTCVTFEHIIQGYCKIGDVDSAMLVHKDMCRKGFRPESSTIDAITLAFCDKSRVPEALEFLRVAMRKHDITPSRRSYEALIKGLCHDGKMEEALKLQVDMVGKGFEPDTDIYRYFIDGYMKQGNEEMAEKLRKEMFDMRICMEVQSGELHILLQSAQHIFRTSW